MSIPLLGGAPASAFFAMTGMSAGLAFQSDHTASQEWVKLRKAKELEDGRERRLAVELLCGKYEQYRDSPPQGPVVAIRVERWSGWAFAEP
jgi:hypothetical protein